MTDEDDFTPDKFTAAELPIVEGPDGLHQIIATIEAHNEHEGVKRLFSLSSLDNGNVMLSMASYEPDGTSSQQVVGLRVQGLLVLRELLEKWEFLEIATYARLKTLAEERKVQ